MGSPDRGELNLNNVVNRLTSGKLHQFTTVSSQYEQFY